MLQTVERPKNACFNIFAESANQRTKAQGLKIMPYGKNKKYLFKFKASIRNL